MTDPNFRNKLKVMKEKPKFMLSPSLSDGEHWTVVDTFDEVIDSIATLRQTPDWLFGIFEGFEVKVVYMTDEQFENLKDV